VPRTRAFIAGVLAARGLRDETACLLASELVTNSVQHSYSRLPGGTITVEVTAAPAEILVEVTDDGGDGVPVLRHSAGPCAEDGRGLFLVNALSSQWGYRRARGQLTTWFQILAEPDRTACPASVPAQRDRLVPSHPPEPAAGTFRAPAGHPADLFNLCHYPVRAVCQVCGKQIEAEHFLVPFQHAEEKLP
jgi:hypothetical protein